MEQLVGVPRTNSRGTASERVELTHALFEMRREPGGGDRPVAVGAGAVRVGSLLGGGQAEHVGVGRRHYLERLLALRLAVYQLGQARLEAVMELEESAHRQVLEQRLVHVSGGSLGVLLVRHELGELLVDLADGQLGDSDMHHRFFR